MDRIKQLHDEIIEKVKEYYKLAHEPGQHGEFVPGQSRINYAGRVYDEKELCNLVDSGLEFWLTYGRYSREFEENLRLSRYSLGSAGKFRKFRHLLAFAALTSPLLKEPQVPSRR